MYMCKYTYIFMCRGIYVFKCKDNDYTMGFIRMILPQWPIECWREKPVDAQSVWEARNQKKMDQWCSPNRGPGEALMGGCTEIEEAEV
jgi:hypothetical protein